MGQKVHPLGFRLGITQNHQSFWCTKPRVSAIWVQDASFLRDLISKQYKDAGITSIEIHRRDLGSSALKIEIYAARPAIFVGRLDELRTTLVKKLDEFYRKRHFPSPGKIQIDLYVKPISQPEMYASILAERLVEDLEQRKPYRRAMRQLVQRALRPGTGVKGIKVQISGRLNGADIARSEDVREGPVPLQTLRAQIDYASRSAKTIYGLLGVKIWVFTGEKLTPLQTLKPATKTVS
uniref:Small ribosomal subunit protein uS3c n=1 Tax=Marvania geminata TaxID=97105 RepID=A0A097KRB1_9CHLO|nr:ribosomal protein S3 [Marvania geminata]AIT95704.1 ribosomal protein S3 [Marvania geminata]